MSMLEETHGGANNKTIPLIPRCLSTIVFIFLDSIKAIFLQNPKLFFIIYTLGALPLSLLITSLSLSSLPRHLKSYIVHLEWLFRVVDIWIEAGNVKETSQLDLHRLHRFKVLHAIPIFVFSLFTTVATVITVSSRKKFGPRAGFRAVVVGIRAGWARPTVTCVVGAVFWVVWGHVLPASISAVGYPASALVTVVAAVVEVYAMTLVSVGLVVSVAEERAGFDAIWTGSGLMKGRRVSGWVLSGLIVMVTNFIGKEMVGVMDGQDWVGVNGGFKWTVGMRAGYMIGLMILLGWVVMWSYVAVTIFYCDCKKRNAVNIRQDDQQLDSSNIEI